MANNLEKICPGTVRLIGSYGKASLSMFNQAQNVWEVTPYTGSCHVVQRSSTPTYGVVITANEVWMEAILAEPGDAKNPEARKMRLMQTPETKHLVFTGTKDTIGALKFSSASDCLRCANCIDTILKVGWPPGLTSNGQMWNGEDSGTWGSATTAPPPVSTPAAGAPKPAPRNAPPPVPTPTYRSAQTPTSAPPPVPTPTSHAPPPVPTPTNAPPPVPTPTSHGTAVPPPVPTPTSHAPPRVATPGSLPPRVPTPTSSVPPPVPTPTSKHESSGSKRSGSSSASPPRSVFNAPPPVPTPKGTTMSTFFPTSPGSQHSAHSKELDADLRVAVVQLAVDPSTSRSKLEAALKVLRE